MHGGSRRHKRNGYTRSEADWPALRFSGIRLDLNTNLQVVIAASTVNNRTGCRNVDVALHYADERVMQKVRDYCAIFPTVSRHGSHGSSVGSALFSKIRVFLSAHPGKLGDVVTGSSSLFPSEYLMPGIDFRAVRSMISIADVLELLHFEAAV